MTSESALLGACHFPPSGDAVALAVSGGPDSLGLALLARVAGLRVWLHHVDHHARPTSADDAAFVADLGREWAVPVTIHDVHVTPGPNFEARARAARRAALPVGALTGHTLDDLAETIILNLVRGAGLDGLSPMVGDPTKPLIEVRRRDLHEYVAARGYVARHDETNLDGRYRRNRVRHEVLPLLDDVADRDVAPLLARAAHVIFDERRWIEETTATDELLALGDADCRDVASWPAARARRWLRVRLAREDPDGVHPPEAAEIERALAVVRGEVVATQLAGGRRLARRHQRLFLD